MWVRGSERTTTASGAALWALYEDPVAWPSWDPSLVAVEHDGLLQAGSAGRLRPRGGPAIRFQVIDVVPGRSFTTASRLPGATLAIAHLLESSDGLTTMRHEVRVHGPLSSFFGPFVGRAVAAGLPVALQRLTSLAEDAAPAKSP